MRPGPGQIGIGILLEGLLDRLSKGEQILCKGSRSPHEDCQSKPDGIPQEPSHRSVCPFGRSLEEVKESCIYYIWSRLFDRTMVFLLIRERRRQIASVATARYFTGRVARKWLELNANLTQFLFAHLLFLHDLFTAQSRFVGRTVLNGPGDQCRERSDENQQQDERPAPPGKLYDQDNGRNRPLGRAGDDSSGSE